MNDTRTMMSGWQHDSLAAPWQLRPWWKRLLLTAMWLLLLLVPFIGFWAVLRPFFNERPAHKAKLFCSLALVVAIVLSLVGASALAGLVSLLNWLVWLHMVWTTTDTR